MSTRASLCFCAAALAVAAGSSLALAQATATVNVQVNWTDREGSTHGAAWLRVGRSNGFKYANANGNAAFTASVPSGNSASFFGLATSEIGNIDDGRWVWAQDPFLQAFSASWAPDGPVVVPGGETRNTTFTTDNSTDFGRSVGMLEYLGFMRNYYIGLGAAVPGVALTYGSTAPSDVHRASYNANRISLSSDMWAASDVLMHEMGHHVAISNGLATLLGGPHNFGGDNIRGTNRPGDAATPAGTALGAVDGSRLAWGEGVATYLGLGANVFGEMGNAPGLNGNALSQYDTDTFYDDISTNGNSSVGLSNLNFGVSIESNIRRDRDTGTLRERGGTRLGEGDEWSVASILWDFADGVGENRHYENNPENPLGVRFDFWSIGSDRLRYGADTVWSWILRGQGPGAAQPAPATTFHAAWRNIAITTPAAIAANNITGLQTNRQAEAMAAMGEVLVENGIAAVPALYLVNEQRATLRFYEQNNSNSDRFRILIYSIDWSSLVLDSGLIEDATPGVLSTSGQLWMTPSDLPIGGYWWVVLNNAADMNSHLGDMGDMYSGDWYWSGARTLFIDVPGPGSAGALALLALTAARRRRR